MSFAIGEHQTANYQGTVRPARTVKKTGSYTPVLADANSVIEIDSGSSTTVTIPPDSSVAFDIGVIIAVFQQGTGAVTVAQGAGVTVRSSVATTANRTLLGQYSEASVRKRGADDWVLVGDLT